MSLDFPLILETIVGTVNADGSPHLAPLGVHPMGERLLLAPFRPSRTLDNLKRSAVATINATDDVRLFAGLLTGRREWPTKACQHIAAQRLEDVLWHAEVEVELEEDDATRPRFLCNILFEQNHQPFRGFNRAQFAVVEAAILYSRISRLPPEKITSELQYLAIGQQKTAGPQEQEAWEWLMEAFRAKGVTL
jgi:hypothetical protein